MNGKMFCFQCEQTCGGSGCTASGVCGKNPAVAQAQDLLTGALIGLARAVGSDESKVTEKTDDLVVSGLFTTITNVSFDEATIKDLIDKIHDEKSRIAFAADSYGDPQPANVTMTIEKGPFIVVTGHDLKDLELLLRQTEGQGVCVCRSHRRSSRP